MADGIVNHHEQILDGIQLVFEERFTQCILDSPLASQRIPTAGEAHANCT